MISTEKRPRLLALGWSNEDIDLFAQLQQMGFGISPVLSKQEAVKALLSEESFTGLMINADTDQFDAYLLCRMLRATFHLPIVMVAANGQRINPAKAVDAGADDWALLPLSSREFAARIFAKMRRYDGLHDLSTQSLNRLGAVVH